MNQGLMIGVVVLPFLGGAIIPLLKKSKVWMEIYTMAVVLINTAVVFYLLSQGSQESVMLIRFTGELAITLHLDGTSMIFAGLVAGLWPLSTLYAFEYMKHESKDRNPMFFMFYTFTYGVTMGIALAGNLLAMYCFYELLTLVTVPLVMYSLSREAILASRKYLYYSLGGAAFAFIGLIYVIVYGLSTDFIYGGVLDPSKIAGKSDAILFIYMLTVLGLGVKAAICPFNAWLPDAGVAPTPVTALLHAVAVVKAGAFAIIRITYYSFGTTFLKGSWAQKVLLVVVMFTIVYGCSMALKETGLKRRLAYSTISNISYILFGALLMTPSGLTGAYAHMISHGTIKITAFFCAGAIIIQSGKTHVFDMHGLAKGMPRTYAVLTVSALGLMGLPGLAGFVSKWYLAMAAVETKEILPLIGVGCLLVSALLTAIYMLSMVIRGYMPPFEGIVPVEKGEIKAKDPGWRMQTVFAALFVIMLATGLFSSPLLSFFERVASGQM